MSLRVELRTGDGALTSITIEEAAQLCGARIERNDETGRLKLWKNGQVSFCGTEGELVDYFQFQARVPTGAR